MTLVRPMFPPRVRGRHVPIYCLSPNQLEALHSLHQIRKEAEDEIDRLIAFLDMVDGCDVELEDEHDDEDGGDHEPSLGWTVAGAVGNDQDRECDLVPA